MFEVVYKFFLTEHQ